MPDTIFFNLFNLLFMAGWKDTLNALGSTVTDVVTSFGDNIENQALGNRAVIDREQANTQIAIAEAQQKAEMRDKAIQLAKIAIISLVAIMFIVVLSRNAKKIAEAFK